MVRLGEEGGLIHYHIILVSIPVWFDWEKTTPLLTAQLCEFQFQYGSIGRNFINYIIIVEFYVSIPVWFDWERMLLLNPEMNYLVSIPVWFDWEE